MSDVLTFTSADPTAKPILLCLARAHNLETWISRMSALRSFVLIEAPDLPTAADMARTCRADLLVWDQASFPALPADCKACFPASPLGWLPLAALGTADRRSFPVAPKLEDVLGTDLPAEQAAIRLRAVLRRQRPMALTTRVHWESLELRHDERTVLVDGRPVSLTYHEFNLLALLLEAPGHTWSREELRRGLLGVHSETVPQALNRLVQSVRRQLASQLGHEPIKTIRGKGYRLA